jgi:FlaA1/EpsC-like NDP-sugar epimerase
VATGRSDSLFAADLKAARGALTAQTAGRRILAIGAAGTIGTATVETLLPHEPAAVVVVDQNENALAELVRRLRSRPEGLGQTEFRTLPIDYGSPVMARLIAEEPPFDMVLHFAAIKHVRSEKDVYSVLQMIDTNIVKFARLLRALGKHGFAGRLFSVSTDKAANPTSFMGATKRVMEHVVFQLGAEAVPEAAITSARFANVAFSNGSLLQSFEQRLALAQPLAAPKETRRYFVSRRESGQICAIAAAHAPSGAVVIPRLDPEKELTPLETVARRFLARAGYEPAVYVNEADARAAMNRDPAAGRWPLLLTPLDTVGEKPFEEFVAANERAAEIGLSSILAVERGAVELETLRRVVGGLEAVVSGTAGGRDEAKNLIGRIEPSFLETHRDSLRHLDERM